MDELLPIKGSAYIKLPKRAQQDLILSGVVPVNDVFFDLWVIICKILLLFGGYGSGKSVFAIDRLLNKCRSNEYFRCLYGRKVLDTVRGSIFATITDRIEELHLQHEFTYSKSDNSSMVIKCKANGNTFHPFGADNIGKLLSIKDPSDILCDEFDQFTQNDFGVLISRLRTEKAETQFTGLFNTTNVKAGHWIKPAFFDEGAKQQIADLDEYTITKRFCNYPDNYFLNKKQYEQTLWVSAGFNEQKFNEISNGEWGASEIGNPFIFNFDKRRHIVKGLEYLPKLPILLSFDFNVEPITCLVGQCDGILKVRILDEYRLMNSDIEELCNRIVSDFPDKMILVTGDASGQARTALKRDLNYYKEIKRHLRLGMGQFKLQGSNPPIKNTRVLCNALLKKHEDYLFSDRVPYLVLDIEQCQVDENGGIDKTKDAHKSHLLDCWRYFNWTFLNKFLDLRLYDKDVHGEGNKEDVPSRGHRND